MRRGIDSRAVSGCAQERWDTGQPTWGAVRRPLSLRLSSSPRPQSSPDSCSRSPVFRLRRYRPDVVRRQHEEEAESESEDTSDTDSAGAPNGRSPWPSGILRVSTGGGGGRGDGRPPSFDAVLPSAGSRAKRAAPRPHPLDYTCPILVCAAMSTPPRTPRTPSSMGVLQNRATLAVETRHLPRRRAWSSTGHRAPEARGSDGLGRTPLKERGIFVSHTWNSAGTSLSSPAIFPTSFAMPEVGT